MLRKYSATIARRSLFSKELHTPAWLHSLMGNQAKVREQFEANRNELLATHPKTSGFDPIREILNKSYFDRKGEKLLTELGTLQNNPETKPVIDAAGILTKKTNFKLIFVNALLYYKDYDYLLREMLRKRQFNRSFQYISNVSSLYTPLHHAILIKRSNDTKLASVLFSQLLTLLHTTLHKMPDNPTQEEIHLARLFEITKINLPQYNTNGTLTLEDATEKLEQLTGSFSSRIILEAIEKQIQLQSEAFHQALNTDMLNAQAHNQQDLVDQIITSLLLNTSTATGKIPVFMLLYQILYLGSHLAPEETRNAIQILLPDTLALARELIIETCKRYMIREQIAPQIISRLNKKKIINPIQHEKIEELLNEKELAETLHCTSQPKAIASSIAKHLTLFPSVDKNNLRETIKIAAAPNKQYR